MHSTENFGWKIYLFLFAIFALGILMSILHTQSQPYAYYRTLICFNLIYTIQYYLNVGNAFITFLSVIPLFLFVFHFRFLKPAVWQWFWATRIVFDLTGHGFEVKVMQSFLITDKVLAAASILIGIGVILPSYIACYRYAFCQKDLFASTETL